MDRLHLITVFVAVVDTGGLAGAARKLGVSPPASRQARAFLDLATERLRAHPAPGFARAPWTGSGEPVSNAGMATTDSTR